MKRLFAVLALTALLAACVTKPIYQVNDRPMPRGAQTLSMEQIQRAITIGVQSRGWQVQPLAPGRLRATLQQEKRSAAVDIVFDQQKFSILRVSSTGFREGDGTTIHTRYNNWIHVMEQDIQNAVNTAAVLRNPPS